HERQLQVRQLEYQTRAALRETYAELLVAQRRSREASLRLANEPGPAPSGDLEVQAVSAHGHFIDLYHRLNLDASREMWEDARVLRNVLDHMLKEAKRGNAGECETLAKTARSARQNLERSFRIRLC